MTDNTTMLPTPFAAASGSFFPRLRLIKAAVPSPRSRDREIIIVTIGIMTFVAAFPR